MSNAIWPMWSQPARSRVMAALATQPGQYSVREIARLAHVSPSTALRITDDLVRRGTLERKSVTRKGAYWQVRQELLQVKPSERGKLLVTYGRFRSRAQLLAYLTELDAPVWVVDAHALVTRGVTRRVPTFVVLPRSWSGRFRIPRAVPVAVFEQAGPLQRATGNQLPWLELLVALLKVDPLAAQQLYATKRTWRAQERRTMLRRINAEGAREAAIQADIDLDRRRR